VALRSGYHAVPKIDKGLAKEVWMTRRYDYLSYTIPRGRAAWASFAGAVRENVAGALARAQIELLALFSPQLGFASNEAVMLVRGVADHALPEPLLAPAGAVLASHDHLQATVRPKDEDRLKEGGIYVHRWFTIDGDRVGDFVDLSNRAWTGFEGAYDTEVFGLFRARPSAQDQANSAARLLLLTWYKNHAVWEASREQAQDAKSLFAQRHQLTRTTIGKSSVRVL
jgi:hypothetical protein